MKLVTICLYLCIYIEVDVAKVHMHVHLTVACSYALLLQLSTSNPINAYLTLNADTTAAESYGTVYPIDFLSNGFKFHTDTSEVNASNTYIYMAFAEAPFVNSKGVPCNAR